MKKLLIASAICALSASAQAAPVFSDNFDSDPLGLNATPSGWNVNFGTVDVIGNSNFYDFIPGSGRYIDLDGSTNKAGILAHSVSLTAGTQYALSFDLAGNQRNSGSENVLVQFGATLHNYSLPETAGWTHYTINFTPNSTGTFFMRFNDVNSHDNVGMLLDNVNVAAVPEPETYAMMLAGLGMVGFMVRRRKV